MFAIRLGFPNLQYIFVKAFLLYPLLEIRQIFIYGRMKQSENAHACHVTPANGAIHIGTAWDGLFISVWAFGDASNKIDRTLSTLFCTIFRAK